VLSAQAHLRGEETSMNPLGLAEALIGAMQHAAYLHSQQQSSSGGSGSSGNGNGGTAGETEQAVRTFTDGIRQAIHANFVAGNGTRDLCGPGGLSTEDFIDKVAEHLSVDGAVGLGGLPPPSAHPHTEADAEARYPDVDHGKIRGLFSEYDTDGNGIIDVGEFTRALVHLGVAPAKA
jgi:hypothetical protein